MPAKDAEVLPTPESIAEYVKKNAAAPAGMAHMHGPMGTVRESDYEGHHIVVRTTYEIKVDGKSVTGHIDVSNGGQVAYHGLPNMSFDSAIDLVKKLIDQFPDDFKRGKRSSGGGMSGMAGMSGMSGMQGKRAATKKKAAAKRKSK
jgi:hypothetical protein